MSTIETFYNVTAMNTRRTIGTPTSSDAITTVSSSLLGVLRPVTDKATLFVETNIGREFDFVTDEDADVKIGDNLYIDSAKYDVLGIAAYEDLEGDIDSYLNVRVAK